MSLRIRSRPVNGSRRPEREKEWQNSKNLAPMRQKRPSRRQSLGMRFPIGAVIGYFALGMFLNLLLVAALAYPIKWLWNGCIVDWLHLPIMGTREAFCGLLLLVLLSTVVKGVQFSTKVSA